MKVLIGDIFESEAKTLVNTVNCVGVMGKGIAQVFKRKYPDMYRDYRRRCDAKRVRPGEPYLFEDLLGTSILLFPTKLHWRAPSQLAYIENGLEWFRGHYVELGIESIAFPPLGCGNGGLQWHAVGPLMYRMLCDLPIEIEIYAPFGTPVEELDASFLAIETPMLDESGASSPRCERKWDAILLALSEIEAFGKLSAIGQTTYQKICYFLCRQGVDLGFKFERASYGPYSHDAKLAQAALANCNYIMEWQYGKMTRIAVNHDFWPGASCLSDKDLASVSETVALFENIRSTEDAELASTVVYVHDEIVAAGKALPVSMSELEASILEWKPRWDTLSMREKLRDCISWLTKGGWIALEGVGG